MVHGRRAVGRHSVMSLHVIMWSVLCIDTCHYHFATTHIYFMHVFSNLEWANGQRRNPGQARTVPCNAQRRPTPCRHRHCHRYHAGHRHRPLHAHARAFYPLSRAIELPRVCRARRQRASCPSISQRIQWPLKSARFVSNPDLRFRLPLSCQVPQPVRPGLARGTGPRAANAAGPSYPLFATSPRSVPGRNPTIYGTSWYRDP